MTNEEIEKKIERLDELADRNYRNFQDTGESRYYRAYDKYDQEADLYRRILDTNEEHNHYISLKAAVSKAIRSYENSQHLNPSDAYEAMRLTLNELKVWAGMNGI